MTVTFSDFLPAIAVGVPIIAATLAWIAVTLRQRIERIDLDRDE
jgi:flavin reductase (DIM6/NTAB) family NADH-FMN oxidoreductase RutF